MKKPYRFVIKLFIDAECIEKYIRQIDELLRFV